MKRFPGKGSILTAAWPEGFKPLVGCAELRNECVKLLVLLCVLLGFQAPLFGQAFQISSVMDGEPLGLYMETFADAEGKLTFDDILRKDAESAFKPSREEVPNYGLNRAVQWVKFTLHNPSNQAILVLLEDKFTFVDELSIYYQNAEKKWLVKKAGDQQPFADREVQTRQAVFRFLLEPGSHSFYARTLARGAHQLPLHVWSQDEFFKHNAVEYGVIGILIGFHVVICLYNLFLFFSLKDRTYFFYVAYVICNLLYQCTGLGLIQQTFSELNLAQTIPNEVLIVSVDLVALTALLFSYHFLNIKKRLPAMGIIFKAIGLLDIINIFITVFVSIWWGTAFCLVTASMVTTVLMTSGFLISRKGYLPAIFYLTAWGFYLLGVTGTISNLIGLIPTSQFSRWGQFTGGAIELAILSLALGARINERRKKTMMKITELNQDLENKVKERTAEIQSLLQHIPQGILSIGPQGLVDQNYSAQLPHILGHTDIAGRSFRVILLDRSSITDDEKDQAWQTLQACVGEATLNFDVNVDKLPLQLSYVYQGVEKVLKLTWNKEINSNDEIKHILVTLLDISSEVAAQQQIQRQNQEFEIIKQLVDIGTKKSVQFFSSGDQLIDENERLLQAPALNVDRVKILFVNTHTLKGAARSLHLKELANELHKVEAYYALILKENHAIDESRALREFKTAQLVYLRYRRANTETLGRNDDLKKVAIDREFLQESVQLLRHLTDLDELSFDLKDLIHAHRDELTEMIFMSLPEILNDIMSHADKIAKDLGREAPLVQIDAVDIPVNHNQELALKNAFIHLLRNALDHGIEPGSVRRSKGKPAQGILTVKVQEKDGSIVIEFKDDGKGLAVGKIRGHYARTGKDMNIPLDEIASKIFEAGFSTTEVVSMVSGRGMGMNAVRQYLQAEQGDVSIVLGRALDEQGEFYEFTIRMTLPSITASGRRIMNRAQAS